MRNQQCHDTLKDLWQVIQPTRIHEEAIQQVALSLKYRLDPYTRHIAYAISIELEGHSLRRIYNWESPTHLFQEVSPELQQQFWNDLLAGLAATVTGIVSPRKESRTGSEEEPNSP